MQAYLLKAKSILTSQTAKDTGYLFLGNWMSAIWGLLFTIIVARGMTIPEFGIFSAVVNLVNILISLADFGISSGSVNFVADHDSKGEIQKANEYIKAAFITRLAIVLLLSVAAVMLSGIISPALLATNDFKAAIWAAIVPVFIFPDMFFPFILQAKRKFLQSTIIDNVFYLGRLLFAFMFFAAGRLNMDLAFWSFGFGFVLEIILIIYYLKIDFLFTKPTRTEYLNLIKFSGWLGVNRIVSSISGRLDIQMLAAISGAAVTGIYSISARIASFIIVLAGSYSSVLAPRMASFGNKEDEKKYLVKSTLALIPITLLIIIGILIAEPFIILSFGEKYIDSVMVFKYLALAQVPFIFTVPAVTAIVYSIKKTSYIGIMSFFQLAAIFVLNYYLIPEYGAIGPTITFALTNILLAVYVWGIVINNYWFNQKPASKRSRHEATTLKT